MLTVTESGSGMDKGKASFHENNRSPNCVSTQLLRGHQLDREPFARCRLTDPQNMGLGSPGSLAQWEWRQTATNGCGARQKHIVKRTGAFRDTAIPLGSANATRSSELIKKRYTLY
eukprot:1534364-Rhodomonas_salina.1